MWFWKSRTEILLEKLAASLSSKRDILDVIAKLDKIEKLVCDLLLKSKPGRVVVTILGERREGMSDKIQFAVNLPVKAAPDVVSRELTIVVGGGEPNVRTLGPEETVISGLEGDQDSVVEVSLVDIDDAGNRSEASTATATLVDNVAPPAPGALGIVTTGESFDTEV